MKLLQRKTKRLIIRPLELKDFKAWRAAYLQMKAPQNQWDNGTKPKADLTLAKFKKIIRGQAERRKNDTFYDLAVFNAENEFVGIVNIMEVARGISHTAFLGYRIFNNYWGQGYAQEAVKAIIDIGFKDVKLHRLEAGIDPRNVRSIRLAKKLRMRFEGKKKRALYLREKWVDMLMYTLTTEDVGLKFNVQNLRQIARG